MRSIAFMNQKGGVGKTTCTANLGAALARLGKRVLLVDVDPQGNLSLHFNVEIYRLEKSIYTLLIGQSTLRDSVLLNHRDGLSILPSNIDLTGAELELVNAVGRETVLRSALRPFLQEEPFDFVLFDCPPSLGLLSLNAIASAREVFIPLQTEFFALQGMTRLMEVVDLIRTRLGHTVDITGIISTLYDVRTNLSREVDAEIRHYFGDKVFQAIIHNNIKLAEAPSHGKSIFEYDADCKGAEDFEALAREVLQRGGPEMVL